MSFTLVATTLGWVGAVAAITAYALVSKGRWRPGSLAFQVTNFAAATSMLLVAAVNDVWPSAAANAAWMVIGAYSTVTILRRRAHEQATTMLPTTLHPTTAGDPAPRTTAAQTNDQMLDLVA